MHSRYRHALAMALRFAYLPTFYAYWTGAIILLAYFFTPTYIRPSANTSRLFGHAGEPFNNWDGQWYHYVAAHGYFYDTAMASSVNFFPAFPLAARAFSELSGLSIDASLVVVSNACFVAMLVLLARYISASRPDEQVGLVGGTLAAACTFPPSFFFRMGYTESLFALLLVLVLLLMARRAPLFGIAAIIGLATATRSVGVGLLPAFAFHVWQRSRGSAHFLVRMAFLGPIACWGMASYMIYLWSRFGDPLVWVKAQDRFKIHPSPPLPEKLLTLGSLDPFIERFTPGAGAHWSNWEGGVNPLFGMHVADVVFFAAAAVLVIAGFARRLLSPVEFLASAFLFLLPYFSIGYECSMRGFARYSSVVLPAYIVLGQFLARSPPHVAALYQSACCVLLYIYSCQFFAGYSAV